MVGIDSAPHAVPAADGEVLRIAVCVKAVPGSTEVKLDPRGVLGRGNLLPEELLDEPGEEA